MSPPKSSEISQLAHHVGW